MKSLYLIFEIINGTKNIQMTDIGFIATDDKESLSNLKTAWRNSITFPHDSFWDAQFESSQHWALKLTGKTVGYACVSPRNTLYQFYISPKYLNVGTEILGQFIKEKGIKKALVGTNEPIYLSQIMHFQKSVTIDSYIFKDVEEITQEERDVEFRVAELAELEKVLDFTNRVYEITNPSKEDQEWSINYYTDCLRKGVIYILENKEEFIGVLEVRTTDLKPKKTTFGVGILPKYRNKGYGSYLLCRGKLIAKSRDSESICGCDMKNISSKKAIEKSGFRVFHSLLMLDLTTES